MSHMICKKWLQSSKYYMTLYMGTHLQLSTFGSSLLHVCLNSREWIFDQRPLHVEQQNQHILQNWWWYTISPHDLTMNHSLLFFPCHRDWTGCQWHQWFQNRCHHLRNHHLPLFILHVHWIQLLKKQLAMACLVNKLHPITRNVTASSKSNLPWNAQRNSSCCKFPASYRCAGRQPPNRIIFLFDAIPLLR